MIRYTTRAARPQQAVGREPFNNYTSDTGSVWTEFYRTADGYLLRFPGYADFEVSADGTNVMAWPTEDCDSATIEHLYINQLVPLALSRQGQPAFHASAVAAPGGAIAFLGKSGMGKSTLAAAFSLGGTQLLTDDALLIEEQDEGCFVLPSHPSLRLWEDSKEALIAPGTPQAAEISYSSKARLLAGEAIAFADTPARLLAAYVLGPREPDDVAIEALSGLDRYMSWTENSFLLDVTDRDLLSRHFEWTDRISKAVPTFSLDYRREYDFLPDLRKAIMGHVIKLAT